MTTRRHFLAAAALLAVAGRAGAQAGATSPRIGWICYTQPGVALPAFQAGLNALGYTGRSEVRIEVRVVEPSPESVKAAVDELIAMPVSLIVTQAAVSPVANRAVAGRVPVVFAFSGDPAIAGMVASLARPGGNTTGMSFLALELVGKRFELMKQIQPSVRRVAVLANPQHPGENAEREASVAAAAQTGTQVEYVQILPGEPVDAAFGRIRQARVQGVVVFQDSGMVARAGRIAGFALKERLLAVSGWAQFADDGFIATYGPALEDAYRRLAVYVDRLLKGARAADLPVELPTRFELVLNLRTARALAVTIPQSVLVRADRTIA
jgi:putative ABC transport system substrate-binding protein